jgi:hypothetical protein
VSSPDPCRLVNFLGFAGLARVLPQRSDSVAMRANSGRGRCALETALLTHLGRQRKSHGKKAVRARTGKKGATGSRHLACRCLNPVRRPRANSGNLHDQSLAGCFEICAQDLDEHELGEHGLGELRARDWHLGVPSPALRCARFVSISPFVCSLAYNGSRFSKVLK